MSNVHQKTDNN